MKTYTLTLDEGEAHAVGFALMAMIRAKKAEVKDMENKGNFDYLNELVSRLENAYQKLDTAEEKIS